MHNCTKNENTNKTQASLQALKLENVELHREGCDLLQRVKKAEAMVSRMGRVFTKGQIKRLINPHKKSYWNYEEIADAMNLFTASPLMYKMLWQKKYPLPSPSTLRKWAATLKLRPGILISTIKLLADNNFATTDRLCVLTYYEIRLKKPSHTDEPDDSGLRPYKYAQMFIIRGLVGEWKKIIYYNFDCMLPGLIVKDIIRALKEINFTVVAVVTGVGPRKLSLWRELGIDENHSYLEVLDEEKVFFFANIPHLMKRLRNKFIEKGFLIKDKSITVQPLREMLEVEPSELWVSHDLTQKHIDPKVIGSHNHHLITQLFSKSVSDTLKKCVALGKMSSPYAIECAEFIQIVDEWFSLFNAKYNARDSQNLFLYGLALEYQNSIISLMKDVIKEFKVIGSEEDIQPLKRGILLNNLSLPYLYVYLKDKYNVPYIITNNLNADDVEHCFGIRKSHAGIAHRPTPLEFKYRLRAGIFANLAVNSL